MASNRIGFDLRSVSLGTAGVAFFSLKRDAVAFAKANGWTATDVSYAWNRFNAFFVVCQPVCDDLRILRKDGTLFQMPNPGRS